MKKNIIGAGLILLAAFAISFFYFYATSHVDESVVLKPVEREGKWGFADLAGKDVISAQYDEAGFFSEGLAGVRLGDKWGFVDKTGKLVINIKYDEAGFFSKGSAKVRAGDQWFFINKSGNRILNQE